jgi:hypothetical protein
MVFQLYGITPQGYMASLLRIKWSQKKLSAVCPGGLMSLDDGLHSINQGMRLFHEGGCMVFPIKEVCDGEGLIDKCWPSSLYLTMLVIIYWAMDLSQEHLQDAGSQRGD